MRKILLQLDGDRAPSVFDAITACDAGAEVLLQYGGVRTEEVRDLVYGAMFTRGVPDLKNSAVFIGGTDVALGEAMLREAMGAFFGPMRVSVMFDANGCNTTATAAVAKMLSVGDLTGRKAVVLAGTGPVGQRAAALLAKADVDVTLTSRTAERAEGVCAALGERFGVRVTPAATPDADAVRAVLEGAHAVLCAGAAGVTLVDEGVWRPHPTLRAVADVNAVPPLGVAGIEVTWNGKEIEGKKLFGAIGIGDFKMKVHRRCIAQLFERNDLVLDAEEIFALATELAE